MLPATIRQLANRIIEECAIDPANPFDSPYFTIWNNACGIIEELAASEHAPDSEVS